MLMSASWDCVNIHVSLGMCVGIFIHSFIHVFIQMNFQFVSPCVGEGRGLCVGGYTHVCLHTMTSGLFIEGRDLFKDER